MTREEITNSEAYQVSKAALEYYNEHHQDKDIDLTDAFEAGFEYANKVNGKELLYVSQKTAERTRKEVVGKACKWLEDELYKVMTEPNPYYISEVQSKSYGSLEVLINEFKKAMEE